MTDVSAIIALFPNPVLTLVGGLTSPPIFSEIRKLQTEQNANAASIHSNFGNGTMGHLHLTLPPAEYLVLSGGIAFVAPINPPLVPTHAPNATAAQITETNRLHKEAKAIFALNLNVDRALRNLTIIAVHASYIRRLSDDVLGFGLVTSLRILQLLWTNHGTITQAELEENNARLRVPWAPPIPIEDLFTQLELGQRFSQHGLDPLTDNHIIRLGYNLIRNTGLFAMACRDWRQRPVIEHTMTNFQTHFRLADADRREDATAHDAGYHANIAQGLAEANGAALAASNAAAIAAYVAAQVPVGARQPAANAAANQHGPVIEGFSYCWTHGLVTNPDHNSNSCDNPAHGHIRTATLANMQGGNNRIWVNRGNRPNNRRAGANA